MAQALASTDNHINYLLKKKPLLVDDLLAYPSFTLLGLVYA